MASASISADPLRGSVTDTQGRIVVGASVSVLTGIAWEQTHLSSLDLGDRRTGAGRTTTSIRNFFLNGARNRGWVGNVSSARHGDEPFAVSGHPRHHGVWLPCRANGAHEVVIDFENLGDENYRDLSWGFDGPGRGVSVRYGFRF